MKILFVMFEAPYPANSGQRVRNLSLLRAVREEGHEISLLSFGKSSELSRVRRELSNLCISVDFVPPPEGFDRTGLLGRARALFSSLPYGAWRMRSAEMAARVRNHLLNKCCDLVICDDVYQIANLSTVKETPVVLNKHTIVFEEFERFLRYQKNPLVCAYGRLEVIRLRRLETEAVRRVAAVWPCSERDRQVLVGRECGITTIVPNAVDTSSFSAATEDDGHTILYVGAMDWLPNRDAVEFFVSHVMPELRLLAPQAKFVVAGREPPERFRQRMERSPSVTFTGTLPDLRPLIASAAVCVVPLRIGSGTRLKILEAAASGKAVVSTSVGAEGLNLLDGSEIQIADSSRCFAEAVASLLADQKGRFAMGQMARRRVLAEYSLPALQNAVRQALAQVGECRGYRAAV